MNVPVQASALDLLVKSTPAVIIAIAAFYFMEVNDQRQDRILQQLIGQQRLHIVRLEDVASTCFAILTATSVETKQELIDGLIKEQKRRQEQRLLQLPK